MNLRVVKSLRLLGMEVEKRMFREKFKRMRASIIVGITAFYGVYTIVGTHLKEAKYG